MADPFVGEIRMFAGNFAPRGWSKCDGQLLAVSQNDALFSLLGTTYGGDGRTTFALPDMRSRIPLHQGTGPGLSNRKLGAKAGTEDATVSTVAQLPFHSHTAQGTTAAATTNNPNGAVPAVAAANFYFGSNTVDMSSLAVGNTGGTESHKNVQPCLVICFIIALTGVYPSRN